MENASKALLIAAAVLIVILIVAFGMNIFKSAKTAGNAEEATGAISSGMSGATGKLEDAIPTSKEASEFNAQFADYIGDNKSTADVLKLATLIKNSERDISYITADGGNQLNTYMPGYTGTCKVEVVKKKNRIYYLDKDFKKQLKKLAYGLSIS